MKTKDFAVSVQYGVGHHFFISSEFATRELAEEAFKHQVKLLFPYKKKGVKPTVYLWERLESDSGEGK